MGAGTTRHTGGVNRDAKVRAGDLLVATRALVDPNFSDSVVLVVDADGDGALGVVLNRPSAVPVAQVLDGWAEVVDEPETLFVGGPVSPEGALAVGLLSPDAEPPLGFREFAGRLGLVDLDTPIEILDGTLVGMRIFAGLLRLGGRTARGGDRGGQLARGARRGPRRVPARPQRAVARRAAAPARRARVDLHAAARPGLQLARTAVTLVR